MRKKAGLAFLALIVGVAGALFTSAPKGVQAESALEFMLNQQKRAPARNGERSRFGRPGGLFDRLFGRGFEPVAPPPRVVARDVRRAVCQRMCDGAQLAMGFVSTHGEQSEMEAMCHAAGQGEATHLILEEFVPGRGFGLASNSVPAKGGAACGRVVTNAFMTVPIEYDSTLRRGDVVATRDGFKVFVGRGQPPFSERDFVAMDKRNVSAELRKMRVTER